jgi:hypothetical protein
MMIAICSTGSSLFRQSQIVNPASIVRLSAPLTLGDLVPQIGQCNVWAELFDQTVFSVLSRTPATLARKAHHLSRVFAQGE